MTFGFLLCPLRPRLGNLILPSILFEKAFLDLDDAPAHVSYLLPKDVVLLSVEVFSRIHRDESTLIVVVILTPGHVALRDASIKKSLSHAAYELCTNCLCAIPSTIDRDVYTVTSMESSLTCSCPATFFLDRTDKMLYEFLSTRIPPCLVHLCLSYVPSMGVSVQSLKRSTYDIISRMTGKYVKYFGVIYRIYPTPWEFYPRVDGVWYAVSERKNLGFLVYLVVNETNTVVGEWIHGRVRISKKCKIQSLLMAPQPTAPPALT